MKIGEPPLTEEIRVGGEWIPNPMVDPNGYLAWAAEHEGQEILVQLAIEVRENVIKTAERNGVGPGGGLAVCLLVARGILDHELMPEPDRRDKEEREDVGQP